MPGHGPGEDRAGAADQVLQRPRLVKSGVRILQEKPDLDPTFEKKPDPTSENKPEDPVPT